jgi:dienelactone hydrolase
MLTVTKWRIAGPFRLPPDAQTYSEAAFRRAFEHDYLTEIGGQEVSLKLLKPTTARLVDFEHDPNDEPDIGPKEVQFMDQVQQFPAPSVNTQVLFWRAGEFFKITYAAAVLSNEYDTEATFIVSGNSPVKIWLNDVELFQSRGSAVGHDPDLLHISTGHLKRGKNTLLVKLFCFPKRNEFVVRVGTRDQAVEFVREHGGVRDVLNDVVVAPGDPLSLSKNLKFFRSTPLDKVTTEIADFKGMRLQTDELDLDAEAEIPTSGLSPGLYTITARINDWVFSEDFYLGKPSAIAAPYVQRCGKITDSPGQMLDPCATLKALEIIAPGQQFTFRLDWQKRALILLKQLERNLAPLPRETDTILAQRGVHVFSYRSKIDNQVQHYFLHLPKNYDGRSVPLVIVSPHNTVAKPLLEGPVAFNPDLLNKLATYSDEYGYAALWPHGRGRNNNVHIALTDTLEALDDVQNRFVIDASRIYLTGDCGGARNALLFAQRYPDRIAAISIVNTATSSGLRANPFWQDANSPRANIENLTNIPLQLIHGEFFPHSPTFQSVDFRDLSRNQGMDPELIILPGDCRWSDLDPFRISFKFFQGKTRASPRSVRFKTGQLKYATAYWIRITELANPPAPGNLKAEFEGPTKLLITASNLAEIELLPDRFPADLSIGSGPIQIEINGNLQTVEIAKRKEVRIRLAATDGGSSLRKTAEVEGPVAHAFSEPFVIVETTNGNVQEQEVAKKLANQIQKAWEDNYHVPCDRKTDKQLSRHDLSGNIVLTGGSDVDEVTKQLFGSLPFEIDSNNIRAGNETVAGRNAVISAIYPNPLNSKRYVVIVASNSLTGFELPGPDLARTGSYDVAVWQIDEQTKRRFHGEWYWDKLWQHLNPAGAIENDSDFVDKN